MTAGIPRVSAPRFEHHDVALGIMERTPRLSWTTEAPDGWVQRAYELEFSSDGTTGRIDSAEQVLVPWPVAPLESRESVAVRVRVWGESPDPSVWSEFARVEAGLLDASDWVAAGIRAPWAEHPDAPNPPPLMRTTFDVTGPVESARLYITAHGVFEPHLNGRRVGDKILLPGWTVYPQRLRYATFDVTSELGEGENVLASSLGDGWYRGRLGFDGGYDKLYGDTLALFAQLEIRYADGRRQVVRTDESWLAGTGPILSSGLYEGERFDARLIPAGWAGGPDAPAFDPRDWQPVALEPFDTHVLTGFDGPHVRCTQELRPTVTELSGGRHLLDFGQNASGRLRIRVEGERGHTVRMLHAEVLQNGELDRRPLRGAHSVDEYTLSGTLGGETWEPAFTIHGFRYAEIQGWTGGDIAENVVARVYHSDMRRTGWFECSNPLVSRLHENVVWSMRSNFVDLPTDCPQRDERLGWTGDIQVFAPSASFLYDCAGLLSSWLKDLEAEQLPDGTVPWYVPVIPGGDYWTPIRPGAAWGDAAVLVPWALWERFGDREVLARQYESARAWVDLVARLSGDDLLWNTGMQLGDWLDPSAPPDDPAAALTDPSLVATAYAAWSTLTLSRMAGVLGRVEEQARYEARAGSIRRAFAGEYRRADGALTSDTATAYSLAIVFDLLEPGQLAEAGERLAALIEAASYRITTGFVGTPIISEALSRTGHTDAAYRLLLQEQCPSWLYTVLMGGTTTWERWDSMLPDGTVNPGDMTSFNHYALGAVADWLHCRVAGLAPLDPGYRAVRFRPEPGGDLTWASARHVSPYGEYSIRWERGEAGLVVDVVVPTGGRGVVALPGREEEHVGSGEHRFVVPDTGN